jgi:hypothetical protein
LDLTPVDSAGWFKQLGGEIPEFEQLCEMLGERFVAFSFIAGIRISAIVYNQEVPDASLVDFVIGDETETRRLPMADFRERLAAALLSDPEEMVDLPDKPTPKDARLLIGRRYLLLAPIFGVRLMELRFGGARPPTVLMEIGQTEEELTVPRLRGTLEENVRQEISRARSVTPFAIDFRHVPLAEAANRENDYDKTIALLGAWPGPLSLFLRTPQGQALGLSEKATLSRALGILGTAYLEKQQLEWAEEVLRLGVQWGQDTRATAALLVLLADARMSTERYAEAIGLLRRALVVGARKVEVLPKLARCFAKRKRYVAAAICLDEALQSGSDARTMEDTRSEVAGALGGAYERFRERVPLEEWTDTTDRYERTRKP